MSDPARLSGPVDPREELREALTKPCGRCNGRGKESWQVSRNPAEREDWPCNRCRGAGTVTDEAALDAVLAGVAPASVGVSGDKETPPDAPASGESEHP